LRRKDKFRGGHDVKAAEITKVNKSEIQTIRKRKKVVGYIMIRHFEVSPFYIFYYFTLAHVFW